jgi:uncharacterized protein with HEPN domain
MMRVWRDYVADILTSIQEVEEFTRSMDYGDFASDKKTVNAVVRSLEIMGEAAKRVPEEVRQRYPNIPWKRMTGMRDKLIHEYSGVDLEIVWGVVKTELPPVKPLIEQIIEDLKSQ